MITYSFENSVAIITGAAIGIGFEIANQLSAAGASMVINDVDEDALERASLLIQNKGGKCITVAGDSGDVEVSRMLVSKAVEVFGKVDFAIANAGITTFGDFLNYKLEDFQKLTSVNLQGSFFLAQAAAKQFIKQKSRGKIIFMSSVTGHQAHPNLAAYGMTKAALEMLAKSLGVELAPHRITVNAIAPGATLTERTQMDADYKSTWEQLTPTGVVSTTLDISNLALFLLSENARQITSQSIVVDGGWTSVSPPPSSN